MNGASPIAIEVKGLTKSFDGRKVVQDLSMQVKRGTIYGFLGPNGSGKTTTIRMLCGLLTPDSGEGTCLGYDIRREADKIKRQVGYMTQRFSLYQDLSVRENLEFVARLYGVHDARGTAREMIKRLGLSGREEQLAGDLSGGWKQRLALGCAILHDPPVLFLDEPTSGVDPLARAAFWDLIRNLSGSGHTIFVSTHYMDEAEYCHRLALMYRGKVIALGTPVELKAGLTAHSLLNLDSSDPLETMRALEGLSGVRDVAVFGGGLHVTVDDVDATSARMRERLAAHHIEIRTLEQIQPSMEDVFVALIEAEERKAA
jgi:ABC-2 type transport system ATP-binding protein